MHSTGYYCLVLVIITVKGCFGQVLHFGDCVEVETERYFNLDKFLGQWYEIYRFPTWYEDYGNCATKYIQQCGRRIEIKHSFIRDGIEFVLHINSTYIPGDEAVFVIQENNIDPIGIPMSVVATDYFNFAVVYGCKYNEELDIKYILAWILSREPTLSPEDEEKAYAVLNSIPYANPAYLEPVEQAQDKCLYQWTAHVQAVNLLDETNVD